MMGSELKALRKAAGYKAKELAEVLETTPATISRYEHGHAPVPKKIELAVRYLCEPTVHGLAQRAVDKLLTTTVGELIAFSTPETPK